MCETIKTENLLLRPYSQSDLGRQVQLANDISVLRMTGSMPYPYTEADAREWISRHDEQIAAGTHYPFAICDAEDGLIGYVGLFLRDEGGLYELGYWVAREYWGKGVASEACAAVLEWARETLGIRAAQAKVFNDNPASIRVLEKLGFLRTGVRDEGFSRARGEAAPNVSLIWMC